jgi:WD40 repeat protein
MNDAPRVFLSYAREDGEAFAAALRARLAAEEPEVTLWQDRSEMEGGVGWWRQVEEALEKVSFLVIVMTPAALRSANTAKEWRRARQAAVCVYPVKGVPDDRIDYASLPRWMRKAHFFDLEREWETFVRHLKSPCRATRVPFMAPDLRADFVERPGKLDQLLRRLLGEDRVHPVTITTALHGAGGFGKTTLAAALCHHEDVAGAFDDGILWVTLGQAPDLRLELTKLYAALTGERPGFVDAEDAAIELARALEDKNCLIVVDDVWNPAHLKPFLRGGKGCARLVTTRQFEVASGARRVDVDEMLPAEAVRVLAPFIDPSPEESRRLRALARRLGEWPVLLKLASSTLRQRVERGETPARAIEHLNHALDRRGVTAFDRTDAAERSDAVSRTLEVSLDLLTGEERQRLIELSVFPEDTEVPLSAVAALWERDAFDAEELVQRLDGHSLVEFDLPRGSFRIHDILRAFLAGRVADPAALHARLVDAWGDPYHLPSPYAWTYVSHHLVGAGREAELRRLLLDPSWIEAKLEASDIGALLADYERFRGDVALERLQSAIRLSAHVLGQGKEQLLPQLLGRIGGDELALRSALEAKAAARRGPWLRPKTQSLTAPGGPLIRTLVRDPHGITAVAVLPDGRRVVLGSGTGTLTLWDLEEGVELCAMEGHTDWITALAIVSSSGGPRIASGSSDGTLSLWDVEASRTVARWQAHRGWIRGVAATPRGDRLVSAAHDHTLKVWEATSGRELATWLGHEGPVTGVVVSADGRQAVSGSDDLTLKVWDLESGSALATWEGHSAWIRALASTPDGRSVVSGSLDGALMVWDVESGTPRVKWAAPGATIGALAVCAGGRLVLFAYDDGTLALWNIETGERVTVLEGHTDLVRAVATTPDGRRVVSGSLDGTAKVWDVDAALAVRARRRHYGEVSALALAGQAQRVVCASRSGLQVLKLADASPLWTWEGKGARIRALATTPDGARIATGCEDHVIRIWDTGQAKVVTALTGHIDRVTAVALGAEGRRLVSGSHDGAVKVWDVTEGRELWTQRAHRRWITALAITPTGDVVSASHDQHVRVWELETGIGLFASVASPKWVTALAVTPRGGRIVCGSADGMLVVRDLRNLAELVSWNAHPAPVTSLGITRDSTRVVSGSEDGTIRVWRLDDGAPVTAFHAESPVRALVVADDLTIMVAEASGRIHLLQLEGG